MAETTIDRRPPRRQAARPRRQARQAAPGHTPQPPARRPGRAVAQLALPLLRHRQTRPRHQSRRRKPPRPRHSRARHQRPQREAPGSAAAPQDDSPPTAPGSPAACSRTTSPAGPPASAAPTPQRQLTVAATIRNRLLTVPGRLVNHSRPTQTAPAAQHWPWAEHLHHRPATTSATCPCSSEQPHSARRSADPTPPATNPHQPHTPVLHAPKRAGPHTRTSPAATRPQTADPTSPSVDSGLEP